MTEFLLRPFWHEYFGELKNRVVMSAMTRGFAGPDHRCTPAMRDYYARRASDGVALILTEGIIVDATGDGYRDVPYLTSEAQAESWTETVRSVHEAGSRIIAQLWHCGRISHEDFTGGVQPVSSTNRRAEGINRQNDKPYAVPRALRASEIPEVYGQFTRASRLAIAAGFDGIELHLAHGYLADQFFDARVNDRTDRYGGSAENRCRFGLELARCVLQECGPERVMVRISPSREMDGAYDWPDLDAMLAFLIPALHAAGVRMLDVSCARADYYATSGRIVRLIRPQWPHFLMGGASLSPDKAEAEIRDGHLDMVTWGRHILANPDFVSRLRAGMPLRPMHPSMLKVLA